MDEEDVISYREGDDLRISQQIYMICNLVYLIPRNITEIVNNQLVYLTSEVYVTQHAKIYLVYPATVFKITYNDTKGCSTKGSIMLTIFTFLYRKSQVTFPIDNRHDVTIFGDLSRKNHVPPIKPSRDLLRIVRTQNKTHTLYCTTRRIIPLVAALASYQRCSYQAVFTTTEVEPVSGRTRTHPSRLIIYHTAGEIIFELFLMKWTLVYRITTTTSPQQAVVVY